VRNAKECPRRRVAGHSKCEWRSPRLDARVERIVAGFDILDVGEGLAPKLPAQYESSLKARMA
jgi:hypothetical protein